MEYKNKDTGYWSKHEYDSNGRLIYKEDSYGNSLRCEYHSNGNRTDYYKGNTYWSKYEYDLNNNEIYFENSNGDWKKSEYDSNGNKSYWEDSKGIWCRYKYDTNRNRTYYENSGGYWEKSEYDLNGNRTYYENSSGEKIGTSCEERQTKQSMKDKLADAQAKTAEVERYAKTQVYLLETDATNEVVLRQDDSAVILASSSNGLFDNTVDLYQSDEDGLTDINSIKTALAEYIGDGSEFNSFGVILNDSLNISSSQTTVMSWEKVNRLVNENNDFHLTFVTEYEDEKYKVSEAQDKAEDDSQMIIDGQSTGRGR